MSSRPRTSVPQRNIGTTRNLLTATVPARLVRYARISDRARRGNRTTANTTQINTPGPYSAADRFDAILKLSGGAVQWIFAVKFPRGVNVVADLPQGRSDRRGTTLYIDSIAPNG